MKNSTSISALGIAIFVAAIAGLLYVTGYKKDMAKGALGAAVAIAVVGLLIGAMAMPKSSTTEATAPATSGGNPGSEQALTYSDPVVQSRATLR